MNPITNAKNLNKLNERELSLGLTGSKTSWHSLYEGSAWIFVGGLAYDLTEGDIIAVFSQYGEIVNLNFIRDKKTGKPKGYCFICYEDQRSTILAVDNFSGIKLLNRILRVDHVQDYKIPKEFGDEDEVTRLLRSEGCGPNVKLITEVKKEKLPTTEKTDQKSEKLTEVKREHLEDPEDEARRQDERPRKQIGRKAELHNESKFGTVKVKEEPVDSQYDKYNRRDDNSLRDKNRSERRADGVDDESEKSHRTEHQSKERRDDSRQEQNEKHKKSSEKRATIQSSSSSEDHSRGLTERTSMRDGRDRSYGGNKEVEVRRPVEDDHERSRKRRTESNTYESEDRNRKRRDGDEERRSRVEEKSSDYSEWKGQKRDSDMRSRQCEKSYGGDSRRNVGRQEETAAKRYNEQYDSPSKKSRDHTRKDRSKDRNSDSGKRWSRSSSSDEYDRKKRRN